jgi:drug/metabolite transporter (DMT)-like permease
MTLFALALVLAAAVFHATWNLLAKRVGDGGAVFVWLFVAFCISGTSFCCSGDTRWGTFRSSILWPVAPDLCSLQRRPSCCSVRGLLYSSMSG